MPQILLILLQMGLGIVRVQPIKFVVDMLVAGDILIIDNSPIHTIQVVEPLSSMQIILLFLPKFSPVT